MVTALDKQWEIVVARDLRLPTLVSLLKAAHLTLFELLGYAYGLSLGGRYVGWDILGSFYVANVGKEKQDVVKAAKDHFSKYAALVRPLMAAPDGLAGSISDRRFYVCTGNPDKWAFMVFIRTGGVLHAVLIPIMEETEASVRFLNFLANPAPRFEARLAILEDESWQVSKQPRVFEWPDAGFD
jgi:hypothetical protein